MGVCLGGWGGCCWSLALQHTTSILWLSSYIIAWVFSLLHIFYLGATLKLFPDLSLTKWMVQSQSTGLIGLHATPMHRDQVLHPHHADPAWPLPSCNPCPWRDRAPRPHTAPAPPGSGSGALYCPWLMGIGPGGSALPLPSQDWALGTLCCPCLAPMLWDWILHCPVWLCAGPCRLHDVVLGTKSGLWAGGWASLF